MQTFGISLLDAVNVEQSPSKSTITPRPINIASVRAASLRSSGLRAASSRRGTDGQKEKQSEITVLGTETRMSVNELSCLSSSVLMTSPTHLSYTNSQEPGEDSQLNAIAMVDKLVNLNASLMSQKPESSVMADHSCMKGPQSNKGIQSLARNADMKNLQENMGIYDWIDSQPDVNGDLEQVSPTFKGQERLQVGMPTKNRKVQQGMVSDLADANGTSRALVVDEEASSVKQQNTGSQLIFAGAAEGKYVKEGGTYLEHWPLKSMQKLGVDLVVSKKLHDTNASYEKGEAEIIDIGANTQIALEAMDIMRCDIQFNHQSVPYTEKAFFTSSDTGHNAETATGVMDIMSNDECAPQSEKAKSSLSGIGNDTQNAIDAIDTMRHVIQADISLSKVKGTFSLVDIGNDTQTALDAIEIMRHGIETDIVLPKVKTPSSLFDIGYDTQTAIEAIDIMRHGIETGTVLSKIESREKIGQGLRVADVQKHASRGSLHAKRKLSQGPSALCRKGGLLSKATTFAKLVRKKGSSREVSKTLKSQRSALFNPPAGPVYNSSKRFLLDFSSAMVPRRKRSHLCAPRGTLHENGEVFGCQEHDFHLLKSLTKADKQAQPGQPASFESQKSPVWPKQDGNSPEVAVLTESTNGESVKQPKKKFSTKLDCYTSLEQSRKRRKCESRCIFVLFSHSLSEATIKQQKKMLIKLGGHVATVAEKATHFVADSFVRSRNMLEIMAAGKVVVTTMWLEGCSQAEYFVDENSYILQDAQKEKQWGFCMHSSLAASRRKPLFKGMKVVVSPNTAPDFAAIKAVVECAGGQAMQKLPSSSHSKADEIASVSFLIGSEKDYDFCVEFLKKGCKVYSTELILHGVVTQNLDFSRNHLFEDYIP